MEAHVTFLNREHADARAVENLRTVRSEQRESVILAETLERGTAVGGEYVWPTLAEGAVIWLGTGSLTRLADCLEVVLDERPADSDLLVGTTKEPFNLTGVIDGAPCPARAHLTGQESARIDITQVLVLHLGGVSVLVEKRNGVGMNGAVVEARVTHRRLVGRQPGECPRSLVLLPLLEARTGLTSSAPWRGRSTISRSHDEGQTSEYRRSSE
ncbi:MAG: hypothetical protein JJ863_15480 [Deltaproteobacteria bacterium]|nr:hypothetical protein [Deltaproteobacteria bacterium]